CFAVTTYQTMASVHDVLLDHLPQAALGLRRGILEARGPHALSVSVGEESTKVVAYRFDLSAWQRVAQDDGCAIADEGRIAAALANVKLRKLTGAERMTEIWIERMQPKLCCDVQRIDLQDRAIGPSGRRELSAMLVEHTETIPCAQT